MPSRYFDISIPTPLVRAFRSGKGRATREPEASVGSTHPQSATSARRPSWAKLGRSLAGPYKRRERKRAASASQGLRTRAASSEGLPSRAPSPWLGTAANLREWLVRTQDDIGVGRRAEVVEDRVRSRGCGSPEGSDSDYTVVPTDGSVTPATLSRASSYKKEVDTAYDDGIDSLEYEQESAPVATLASSVLPLAGQEPGLYEVRLVQKAHTPQWREGDYFDPRDVGRPAFRPLHAALAFQNEGK